MASSTDRSGRDPLGLGGLQLSNRPGDKLGPGNSLICDNWRVDQDGQLTARRGSGQEAGPIGSGTFHTLRRTDNNRYGGIGTTFYYGTFLQVPIVTGLTGNPCGVAFYQGWGWLMDPNQQSMFLGTIAQQWGVPPCPAACTATGGGSISNLIDEYQDGSNGLTVGLTSQSQGPTNQFTNYAMQNGVPVVGDTDGSGICVAVFDPNTISPGAAATASLALGFTGAIGATAYFTSLAIDTTVDGNIQDQDYFQVNIQCSDPTQVTSITVYVKTGTAGYAEYTFTNPQQFLSQGLNTWSQLKIFRQLNLDNFSQQIAAAVAANDQQTVSDLEAQFATLIQSPTFIYLGSGWPQTGVGAPQPSTFPPSPQALAIDWTNITDFGVSIQVASACYVNIDEALVFSAVNNNSTGAVNYFVSFANSLDQDGIPGPASNPIIGGPQQVTLTGIPVSSSPWVTQRYIWKIGGGLSQAYQVGIIPDNTTTGPFVDTTTNAQLQDDDIVMPGTLIEDSRDLPPPCAGCIGPVFGKIVMWNTALHPARFWWTNAGEPWYVPGALDEGDGNWEDVGPDDDPIIQTTDHKTLLVVYKARSIWRWPGDPALTDPVKTNSSLGLAGGPNGIVNAGLLDYFIGPEGVYSFNGDYETKISQGIDAIFKGDFVQLIDGTTLPPLNIAAIGTCSLGLIGDRLRICYPQSGGEPNVVAIYHIPSGRWGREIYNLAEPAFTVMNWEGAGNLMMAGATGANGGYLYHLESGYLDNGSPFHAVWQSLYFDQSLPDNNKVYTDVEVDCQTLQGSSPASTLTVSIVLNNGTVVELGSITTTNNAKPRGTFIFPVMAPNGKDIGYTAKNAAVRIEGDIVGVVIIFGVYLHWYPEERVALTFDTGNTDFGLPERCKEVDYLEFYMQASGQSLSKILYSDLPGSVLVSRDATGFTAPQGRGNVRFRLAAPVDGRNFRLWTGNNPAGQTFQMFKARARMRPIGEYIDGTIGEYFECAEFSVAPGRVGELKDLLLDYDSTGGNGQLIVYTDLPGNTLAPMATYQMPVQSRAPYVFPFEVPRLEAGGGPSTVLPYGQLFKVRMYPPAGGILRLHGRAQLRARVIGVYFDGSRGEIWETQPLDLLQGEALFREIKIVCQVNGPMTLEFRTTLPNFDMQTVAEVPVNPSSTTGFRLPITARLPGTAKGHLQQCRLVGPHQARIFEVQVLGRRVQTPQGGWSWLPVPMEGTSDQWTQIQIPVRETPESFDWVDMTPDPIQ